MGTGRLNNREANHPALLVPAAEQLESFETAGGWANLLNVSSRSF
jgi:hypothetical protein